MVYLKQLLHHKTTINATLLLKRGKVLQNYKVFFATPFFCSNSCIIHHNIVTFAPQIINYHKHCL